MQLHYAVTFSWDEMRYDQFGKADSKGYPPPPWLPLLSLSLTARNRLMHILFTFKNSKRCRKLSMSAKMSNFHRKEEKDSLPLNLGWKRLLIQWTSLKGKKWCFLGTNHLPKVPLLSCNISYANINI